MTKASKTNMFVIVLICNIWKQTKDASVSIIMVFPVHKIGHTLVDFTTNYKKMESATFIIKKNYINVYL